MGVLGLGTVTAGFARKFCVDSSNRWCISIFQDPKTSRFLFLNSTRFFRTFKKSKNLTPKNGSNMALLAQTVDCNQLGRTFWCRMNLEMHSWHDFGKNVKIVKNGPKMTRSSQRFLITKRPGNSQPQMKIGANDSELSCATFLKKSWLGGKIKT